MSDDPLFSRLNKEVQPELDRMRAEHERTMRLIAQLPEPSEADKLAIAEMNSPEGWQRAIREAIGSATPQRRKRAPWIAIAILLAVICAVLIALWVGLPQSN